MSEAGLAGLLDWLDWFGPGLITGKGNELPSTITVR